MSKVYARQVAPEFQESPLFFDECFPENIAVFGNNDYEEHVPEIVEKVRNGLENCEMDEAMNQTYYVTSLVGYMMENIPPVGRKRYTAEELNEIENLVAGYGFRSTQDEEIFCRILSIVTGKEWASKQISGSAQSEWNNIYYPVDEWTEEALAKFEIQYFNECTEWIVHDEEDEPVGPEDISGYSVYCTEWNEYKIRKELADCAGVQPEDVVMYKWNGWIQTASYMQVTA